MSSHKASHNGEGKQLGKRHASHASEQLASKKRAKGSSTKHDDTIGNKSALSKKERKELLKQRKARSNKNFSLIEDVVGSWETFRRHDVDKKKRRDLVSKVLKKIEGRIPELAASHTASRIVQACIKYGTAEEQQRVLKEVEPHLIELSKSPYGHFVVSKLIDVSPKEKYPVFMKSFKGHVAELLRHPAGTHVLDDLYTAVTAAQRNSLVAECYGREYVLFEGGTLNNVQGPPAKLSDLLERVDGNKRRAVIAHLASAVVPVMDKGLVDSQISHRLISEYIEAAPASLVVDAIESLSGEAMLHMIHTRYGARAACGALAYGTAKDRKKLVRALKGHVTAAATDEWGHLVLLKALSVVDDTALLKKWVVKSLADDIKDLATHKCAHRLYLCLLHPESKRYVPPVLREVLDFPIKRLQKQSERRAAENGTMNESESAAAEEMHPPREQEEDDGKDVSGELEGKKKERATSSSVLGVSKKESSLRRKEILEGSLGASLIGLCTEHAEELLTETAHGADLAMEICLGGAQDGILGDAMGVGAVEKVQDDVISMLKESSSEAEDGAGVLASYFGSRALRRAILSAPKPAPSSAVRFLERLWENVLRGRVAVLCKTHVAKVLAACLQSGMSEEVSKALRRELKKSKAVDDVNEWLKDFQMKI